MNTINDSAIKKLKLLVTVVDRNKGEFYLDVISQFQVNCQMALSGMGTAQSELVELLGLEPHKAVILSVVREDLVDEINANNSQTRALADVWMETIKHGMDVANDMFGLSLDIRYKQDLEAMRNDNDLNNRTV